MFFITTCAGQNIVIKEKTAIADTIKKFQAFKRISCSFESECKRVFIASGDTIAIFNSKRFKSTFPIKWNPSIEASEISKTNKPPYKTSPETKERKYSPIPTGISPINPKDALALSSSIIKSSFSKSIALFTMKNQPAKNAPAMNSVVINIKSAEKIVSGAFFAIPK